MPRPWPTRSGPERHEHVRSETSAPRAHRGSRVAGRRLDGGAAGCRRHAGLALLAALRQPRLLGRPARKPRQRPLVAGARRTGAGAPSPLCRGHAGRGDRPSHTGRPRPHDRLHGARRRPVVDRAPDHRPRRPGAGRAGPRPALRPRPDAALDRAARRWLRRHCRAGPDGASRLDPVATDDGARPDRRRRARGRDRVLRPLARPVVGATARCPRRRDRAGRDHRELALQARRLRQADRLARRRAPFDPHPAGAGASSDRRRRRRAHQLAARGSRRLRELGLPLLLAAGLRLHDVRVAQCGPAAGGRRLARLAAARAGRGAEDAAHPVSRRRRRGCRRARHRLAGGPRRRPPRARRQCGRAPATAGRLRRGRRRHGGGGARRPRRKRAVALGRRRARRGDRGDVATARPGPVGRPRRAAAPRVLEGHGLGRHRPPSARTHRRRTGRRRARPPAGPARAHASRDLRPGLQRAPGHLRAAVWQRRPRRQPVAAAGAGASCPRPIRAWRAPSTRWSSGWAWTDW